MLIVCPCPSQILLNQWNLKALSRIAVIEQNQLEKLILKTWFKNLICVFFFFLRKKDCMPVCIHTQHFWKLTQGTKWLYLGSGHGEGGSFSLFLLFFSVWFEFYLLFCCGIIFKIKIPVLNKNLFQWKTSQPFIRGMSAFVFEMRV